MDEHLRKITPLIAKVADGQNLSSDEATQVFTDIFLYDTDGFHFAVFMSALHAKGETSDELVGLIHAYKTLATPLAIHVPDDRVTDLSGTGGGTVKTINVSTLSSLVVAAAGYTVAKASYYSITSPTGSADILAEFGVDIKQLSAPMIEEILAEVQFCPFYAPFFSPKLENRGELFKKVYKDHGLSIKTTGHIATNAFSPFAMKRRMYGCYSERYLLILAEMFQKLGYKRTLTFYGYPGVPEISNVGKTIIVEQKNSEIKQYEITPEELGVSQGNIDDVAVHTKEQSMKDFLAVLKGEEKGPKADLVAVNAGASLYVLQDCNSLREGTQKAKSILASGEGYTLFERLINKTKALTE